MMNGTMDRTAKIMSRIDFCEAGEHLCMCADILASDLLNLFIFVCFVMIDAAMCASDAVVCAYGALIRSLPRFRDACVSAWEFRKELIEADREGGFDYVLR